MSNNIFAGAKWIGAPALSLDASRQGIFGIEAKFSGSGGIVFGASDVRLATYRRNIQNQAGECYISYCLNVATAQLVITRVGYAESDSADVPLAVFSFSRDILLAENTLTIHVLGNSAATFLNGELIDGDYQSHFFYTTPQLTGRVLNPLGDNDVITFPRLNKVGLIPPDGGHYVSKAARFLTANDGLRYTQFRIFNLRPPSRDLFFAFEDGCACLVGTNKDLSHDGTPVLQCMFAINKEVAHATAYITARGDYICTANGRALNVNGVDTGTRSTDYFTPGAAHFDRHIFYHRYDMMPLLQQGHNRLEFTLGSGWWSDAQNFMLRKYNFWGDAPALCAVLELVYADGTEEKIVSDEAWQVTTDGPIRYASHFHGETYDAQQENAQKCWQPAVEITPAEIHDADAFINAPNLNVTEPEYIEHFGNPVGEVEVLRAVSASEFVDFFIYDMGQNMVGVPRIKVHGRAGQVITLRFGEAIYPNLPRYGNRRGHLFTENLRDADCTDIYICKGDPNGETIFPQLTFHGYRYIEISGLATPPPLEDVEGVVLSSITPDTVTGNFECSNPQVNKLFENIKWSQRANFLSIPTDCPQRNERMGWMGDAQVFAETAAYNANVLPFFRRFLLSVRDLQLEDGRMPDIAPQNGAWGGIPWGSAGIIVPWTLYCQYGDITVLKENYAAMRKYVGYLCRNSTGNLVDATIGGLGDWLAYDMTTDDELVWNAIVAYDVRITADAAKILGDMDVFAELDARYNSIRATWNATFVCPESGKTRSRTGEINDTQTSYALPLYYGIFDNPARAAALLNDKTKSLGHSLTTGFLGTQCIAAALSDNGYASTAYKLLLQDSYPSWLYPITQGATTIWERWNSETHADGFGEHNNMNSFNHYSLGAVGAWLYSRVLGIRPGKNGGYREFVIQPCFGELDYARGHLDMAYGRIISAWEKTANGYSLTVEVPKGCIAQVVLPEESLEATAGLHQFNILRRSCLT